MKKKTLIILSSGLFVFLIGGILFVVGMTNLKWEWTKLDITEISYSTWSQDSAEEFTSVKVDSNLNINISHSDDEIASIEYFYNDDITYDFVVKDGVLNITLKHNWSWSMYPFHDLKLSQAITKVSLPKSFDGDISAKINNQKFKVLDGDYGDINIDSKNSKTNIENINAINIDYTSNNSDLNLYNSTISNSIDVDISNGDFDISNTDTNTLNINSKNNTTKLSSVVAPKTTMVLKNSGLRVSGSGLDTNDFDLDLNNSSAKTILKGFKQDYKIELTQKNSNMHIENQSPTGYTRTLKITANNSSGNFDFKN